MVFDLFFAYWPFYLILSLIIFILILYFTWQGALFKKMTDEDFSLMLSMLSGKKRGRVVDIGSGDGRIVIAFVKQGYDAHGYEIDPRLVRRSRKWIRKERVVGKATIYSKSFWSQDFSSYNIVTVYGIHHIMGRIEKKLRRELSKGSIVLSNYYTFPNWKVEMSVGRVKRYVV